MASTYTPLYSFLCLQSKVQKIWIYFNHSPLKIHENLYNLIIPRLNYENHEILTIPHQNHESHENLIITRKNNENHEIHRIPC